MGIIGRQTIKSAIYIYIGVVIGFFVRAHFFPKYLTEAEIGIIALLVSYGSIFAQTALLGFNHATIKYFPYFRNQEEGHKGFLTLFLLVAILGFLIFLIAYHLTGSLLINNNDSELFAKYYHLCIPLTAGLLVFMVMDNYNTVLYNASTGVLLREFGLRLMMLLAMVPLIYGLINFDTFADFYVATFSILAVLMTAFVIWRGECHLNFRFANLEKNMIRAMASISVFGFFTGLTNVAILQVNNILINEFYDEAQTGIYVTNFFFATLILLPSRGLNKIAPTMISDAFKNGDLITIERIQYKSTINQLLIGTLIFVGLYINLPNIYQILPESFAAGMWVIVLTGIGNLFQMGSGVGSAIIGFSDHYQVNSYLSVFQLLALIILNIMLLPLLGITGAALATLGTMALINLLKCIFIKYKFDIQPYGTKHLLILISAGVCIGFDELIPTLEPFTLDISTRSLSVTILFVTINYFLNTSPQLNDNINKALGMLRIR